MLAKDVIEFYKKTRSSNLINENFDLNLLTSLTVTKQKGSRVNFYYYHTGVLAVKTNNRIVIPIIEESFKRYGDDGRVDREHLLMALSNIELIMVRASFASIQTSVMCVEFLNKCFYPLFFIFSKLIFHFLTKKLERIFDGPC